MILVRLDVNNKIGTGHFRRSSNLINTFNKNNIIYLIETDDKENDIFSHHNVIFTSCLTEYSDLVDLIYKYKIQVVILDFLKYKRKYIQKIKKISNLPLITFHEYEDFSLSSDLAFNYNIFFNKKCHLNPKFFFGYKYIIFDDKISQYKKLKNKDYIFVSFGGSDPTCFTKSFIKNVTLKMPDQFFYIHLGSFSKNNISNEKITNVKFINYTNIFFKYMSEAKKVIVAGGNMMYEAIYLEKKPLVVAHNNHQEKFAKIAQNRKLIKYVGKIENMDFLSFIRDIQANDELIVNSSDQIDNKGKERIIKEIEKLL